MFHREPVFRESGRCARRTKGATSSFLDQVSGYEMSVHFSVPPRAKSQARPLGGDASNGVLVGNLATKSVAGASVKRAIGWPCLLQLSTPATNPRGFSRLASSRCDVAKARTSNSGGVDLVVDDITTRAIALSSMNGSDVTELDLDVRNCGTENRSSWPSPISMVRLVCRPLGWTSSTRYFPASGMGSKDGASARPGPTDIGCSLYTTSPISPALIAQTLQTSWRVRAASRAPASPENLITEPIGPPIRLPASDPLA